MIRLLSRVDDVDKFWLQAGATDEEPVDVGTGGEFLGVGGCHRAAILDADGAGHGFRHVSTQPLAQRVVHILGLESCN